MNNEQFEKTETVVATLRQDIKGEEHMIYECFYDWIREMRKTKADLRYWTDDEEKVAEYAFDAGWGEAQKFFKQEIQNLNRRISLLETEVAFVERGYSKKKEELPTWGNF